MIKNKLFYLLIVFLFAGCASRNDVQIQGELKTWHRVTFVVKGPQASEDDHVNPFLNFRLLITLTQDNHRITIPGFFAADGNAAESGSSSGNVWKAHFMPGREGVWEYSISFRKGYMIALDDDMDAGKPLGSDGLKGSIEILKTDKTGQDFRGKGQLCHIGEHYLQFTETGEYFLKGGADSPENFLAYYEFDGTPKPTHQYEPHSQDWNEGDPLWQNFKGKNIIGALNYLASKGMNSVYFLTMNVEGDGDDVWPWIAPDQRERYDCSKLDQWEIVFSHMDKLGLMMHVITQETENDTLLDKGELDVERKLYYRELIARFAHHPALVWNLGEENTNTDAQRKAFADYIKSNDPYQHPIVVHTFPNQYDKVYTLLLDDENFDGPSLQMGDVRKTHSETLKWLDLSEKNGNLWFVCLDEIGPANTGVKPDVDDSTHDEVRRYGLWGNLLAGGSGCEWYFGYKYENNDLNCEDWRSRENMWDQTRNALDFFNQYLPFWEMKAHDELLSNENAWCFAKLGFIYVIYLPDGINSRIQLLEGSFTVKWYNPLTGGDLYNGSVETVSGPGNIEFGTPSKSIDNDLVVLIEKINNN